MGRGGVSKVFGIFDKDRKSGQFLTSTDSNSSLLESQHSALGGYPALHQHSTREKDQKIWD
jgi:hypothetical protein